MINNIEDKYLQFKETAEYYQSLQMQNDQETLVQFLRETQDIFGCIPADAKMQISEIMGMKLSLIDKIISMYLSSDLPKISRRKSSSVPVLPAPPKMHKKYFLKSRHFCKSVPDR